MHAGARIHRRPIFLASRRNPCTALQPSLRDQDPHPKRKNPPPFFRSTMRHPHSSLYKPWKDPLRAPRGHCRIEHSLPAAQLACRQMHFAPYPTEDRSSIPRAPCIDFDTRLAPNPKRKPTGQSHCGTSWSAQPVSEEARFRTADFVPRANRSRRSSIQESSELLYPAQARNFLVKKTAPPHHRSPTPKHL